MLIRIRSLALAALTSASLATTAVASGPPWISIELPANPYDESTKGAYLLVHSFHHGAAIGYIVTGTAEGIVNGERRSVKLEFAETSRTGVYALQRSWPEQGTWTLVIKANQGPDDAATAVTTTATGTAEFTYVADIPALFYRIDVAGIDSATLAHIHGPADINNPAGVIVNLFTGNPTKPLAFTGTLAEGVVGQLGAPVGMTIDSLLVLLRTGNAYVNVHTRVNGGGEIRGQVSRQ